MISLRPSGSASSRTDFAVIFMNAPLPSLEDCEHLGTAWEDCVCPVPPVRARYRLRVCMCSREDASGMHARARLCTVKSAAWGTGGPEFKSRRSDQQNQHFLGPCRSG